MFLAGEGPRRISQSAFRHSMHERWCACLRCCASRWVCGFLTRRTFRGINDPHAAATTKCSFGSPGLAHWGRFARLCTYATCLDDSGCDDEEQERWEVPDVLWEPAMW
jgi:hypothetical protein